jgi:hypothetical protein
VQGYRSDQLELLQTKDDMPARSKDDRSAPSEVRRLETRRLNETAVVAQFQPRECDMVRC